MFVQYGRCFRRGVWHVFVGLGRREPPQEALACSWAFAFEAVFWPPNLRWRTPWPSGLTNEYDSRRWTGRQADLAAISTGHLSFELEIDGISKLWRLWNGHTVFVS